MNHFITIAGPQSSGKTTAINYLRKKHKDWYFIEEINPYTVLGKEHRGAAYTDRGLQISMMEIELIKLNNITRHDAFVSVSETGIFRLVYTEFFYHKKLVEEYLPRYLELYNKLNSFIIFIKTKPEVSFSRRKQKYIDRIVAENITNKHEFEQTLKKYEETIFRLYPLWLKFYEKIRYPKILINNSSITEKQFLHEIDNTLDSLLLQ